MRLGFAASKASEKLESLDEGLPRAALHKSIDPERLIQVCHARHHSAHCEAHCEVHLGVHCGVQDVAHTVTCSAAHGPAHGATHGATHIVMHGAQHDGAHNLNRPRMNVGGTGAGGAQWEEFARPIGLAVNVADALTDGLAAGRAGLRESHRHGWRII